jgi:hypothetical protein
VDHEFCCRLLEKGYVVTKILTCGMNHAPGEHTGVRMYYITRNCLYMKKYWPGFYKDFSRGKYLRHLFLEKINKMKFIDIYYMYKGIKDANQQPRPSGRGCCSARYGFYAGLNPADKCLTGVKRPKAPPRTGERALGY